VIGRSAGTRRCSGVSPGVANAGTMSLSAGSLSTATFMSPNSGRYVAISSAGSKRPSSTIIIAATPSTGFDDEAIRKIASVSIGRPLSVSIRPYASKWTIFPRRATAVTAPWISPTSMKRSMTAWISSRRSLDMPTSSGAAAGSS